MICLASLTCRALISVLRETAFGQSALFSRRNNQAYGNGRLTLEYCGPGSSLSKSTLQPPLEASSKRGLLFNECHRRVTVEKLNIQQNGLISGDTVSRSLQESFTGHRDAMLSWASSPICFSTAARSSTR